MLKKTTSRNGKRRGFTLLELMVVLAIIAILTTLAAPSFTRMIQTNTMSSNVNTFLADMRYARSESIRRGGGVVMCRSADPEAANPTCDSGNGPGNNGWVSGWIIFHDLNNNGNRDDASPGPEDPILRVQAPITSINSILEHGKLDSSTKFRFTASGRFYSLSSATTLRFGGNLFANEDQRTLCVSLGGRARIAGDGTASCREND